MKLRFASVCDGIGAAACAWTPLGWEFVFKSEIEPFPVAVTHQHWPHVPNYGDMTKHNDWNQHELDVLVGGTPCQAFSVAGLRKGLADPRGNLTLTFLAVVAQYRPKWVVWENVPGVLSDRTGAFGALLGGLGELGYGFAYRVLDAQYFGVAQRRRRVFVVGHIGGDWQRAAAVLFERESLRGNPAPRREAGEGAAPTLSARTKGGGGLGTDAELDGAVMAVTGGKVTGDRWCAHALLAEGFDASEDGTGRGTPLVPEVAWALQERDAKGADSDTKEGHLLPVAFQTRIARNGRGNMGDKVNALQAQSGETGKGDAAPCVTDGMAVRRLTPRECERLQGFPDDWTAIEFRKKPAADGPRYKALGNSMAVPVMRWIGERIEAVDAVTSGKVTGDR